MIFISSSCDRENNLGNFFSRLAGNGIRHIELSGGGGHIPEIESFLDHSRIRFQLTYMVHNYFPPPQDPFILNLASGNKDIRAKSLSLAKKALDLCQRYGCDFYTVHPGYRQDLTLSSDEQSFIGSPQKNIQAPSVFETLRASVDTLCRYASECGLKFGVENLFPENRENNYSLLCSLEEFDHFFECLGFHDNLGILLDLGHAKLAAHYMGFNLEYFLDRIMTHYRSRLLAIHISENDGKQDCHWVPKRNGWISDFLKAYQVSDIPISIEARNSEFADVITYYWFLRKSLGLS